jgi:hypothetical protein
VEKPKPRPCCSGGLMASASAAAWCCGDLVMAVLLPCSWRASAVSGAPGSRCVARPWVWADLGGVPCRWRRKGWGRAAGGTVGRLLLASRRPAVEVWLSAAVGPRRVRCLRTTQSALGVSGGSLGQSGMVVGVGRDLNKGSGPRISICVKMMICQSYVPFDLARVMGFGRRRR